MTLQTAEALLGDWGKRAPCKGNLTLSTLPVGTPKTLKCRPKPQTLPTLLIDVAEPEGKGRNLSLQAIRELETYTYWEALREPNSKKNTGNPKNP